MLKQEMAGTQAEQVLASILQQITRSDADRAEARMHDQVARPFAIAAVAATTRAIGNAMQATVDAAIKTLTEIVN